MLGRNPCKDCVLLRLSSVCTGVSVRIQKMQHRFLIYFLYCNHSVCVCGPKIKNNSKQISLHCYMNCTTHKYTADILFQQNAIQHTHNHRDINYLTWVATILAIAWLITTPCSLITMLASGYY